VSSFEELREGLIVYTEAREELEPGRSHYRALVSFEGVQGSAEVAALAREWLKTAFPNARAFGFVHQNTDNTHAHLWIDARETGGKKIQLKNSEFKRLDESWNRIYCRAMGRDEAEHLDKKQKRQSEKQHQYEQQQQYEKRRGNYQSGREAREAGETVPPAPKRAPSGEPAPASREPDAAREHGGLRSLAEEGARTLRAAQELHREAKRLDEATRMDKGQEHDRDKEQDQDKEHDQDDDGLFRRRTWHPEDD
jgi:hypothetical protein